MATQPVEAVAEAPAASADAPVNNEASTTATLYPDDQPNTETAPVDDDSLLTDDKETDAANDGAVVEAVDPPNSWNAEDREAWNSLDPKAQQTILRREQERDRFVSQKAQEAAAVQRNTEGQAREAVMKVQEHYQAQIQSLMGPAPEQPNPALLASGQEEHRNLFFQQEARFRQWQAQQQMLQQQLTGIQHQAAQLEQQHRDAQVQSDHAILSEQLGPEWTEPTKRQKLLTDLQPIGGELGYSAELMAQANATDILALKRVRDLKVKADKWDDLQKRKMQPVREAKSAPKVTQPGVAGANGAQSAPSDAKAILYPNEVRR